MSGDFLTVEGVVVDCSHGTHTVSASVGGTTRSIKARRSGHLEVHRIKCLPGDRVVVELSPYDLSRGRITKRLRDGEQFIQPQQGA